MVCAGVILVNTPSIESNKRFFAMRKAVKGFADSMLDLIVQNSVAKLVRLTYQLFELETTPTISQMEVETIRMYTCYCDEGGPLWQGRVDLPGSG
jgi:hypothetical protein